MRRNPRLRLIVRIATDFVAPGTWDPGQLTLLMNNDGLLGTRDLDIRAIVPVL